MAYVGFQRLVEKLMKEGKSRKSAEAIAASIGRRKYGAKSFQKHARQGKSFRP